MTVLMCKSAFFSRELADLAGEKEIICFHDAEDTSETYTPEDWLSECLSRHNVTVVMYESRFFVDPAPFRRGSPNTRFVIISGPGDETNTEQAFVCGACAAIEKPITAQDVQGVMSFVSR